LIIKSHFENISIQNYFFLELELLFFYYRIRILNLQIKQALMFRLIIIVRLFSNASFNY